MKYLFAILLFAFISKAPTAQIRFNNRINFGFPAQYITSIVATDSCYYVTGNGVTSVSPYREGIFFAIMDLNGEVLSVKKYDSFQGKYIEYFHNNMFFNEGYFYCTGYFKYPDYISKPILIKFNTIGDTVFVKEYPSNLSYNTSHTTTDGIRAFDGYFYLTSNVLDQTANKYQVDIIKISPTGEHIWSKVPLLPPTGLEHVSGSLVQLTDSTIVLSAKVKRPWLVFNDFIRHNQIIRIDTSGKLLNSWLSPEGELRAGIHNDILQTQDGGLAFTMSFGTEYFTDTLNPHHLLLQDGGICKLNEDFEEEWEVSYVGNQQLPTAHHHFLNRLIELEDGCLVAVGYYFESFYPDSVYLEDYDLYDYWNVNGWILKISAEGDSIWSRQYHYVVSPSDLHHIYDIETTNDGGFIMCGQAGDMFHNPPPGQQGWLIKTDEYGCIVPGCQIGIEDVPEKKTIVKLVD